MSKTAHNVIVNTPAKRIDAVIDDELVAIPFTSIIGLVYSEKLQLLEIHTASPGLKLLLKGGDEPRSVYHALLGVLS